MKRVVVVMRDEDGTSYLNCTSGIASWHSDMSDATVFDNVRQAEDCRTHFKPVKWHGPWVATSIRVIEK